MTPATSTFSHLLHEAFGECEMSLTACGRLNALFREKGLHGWLLAEVFSELPFLRTALDRPLLVDGPRFEDRPAVELGEAQFRALLARYYRHAILLVESEKWPDALVASLDEMFLDHLAKRREEHLIKFAATMLELITGNPQAREIGYNRAHRLCLPAIAARFRHCHGLVIPGSFCQENMSSVIPRVQLAFILQLLENERNTVADSTLSRFLQQVQILRDTGVDSRLIDHLWRLPCNLPHVRVLTEEDQEEALDFTRFQAMLGRWHTLMRMEWPDVVQRQIAAGNWNSALLLLKGSPHFFLDFKAQVFTLLQLQMPLMELETTAEGANPIVLPLGTRVRYRDGQLNQRTALASEILGLLGSRASYPVLFAWGENGENGSLEVLDSLPGESPNPAMPPPTAVEMASLRLFCQVWGVPGGPNADDLLDATRLLQAPPQALPIRPGEFAAPHPAMDYDTISSALTRVENTVRCLTVEHLPNARACLETNLHHLRALIKKRGHRRKPAGCHPPKAVEFSQALTDSLTAGSAGRIVGGAWAIDELVN